MKPQTKRVLRRLKDAGPRGVHTNELRQDPEGWIADPPTRVSELKRLGFRITSDPERLHGKAVGRRYMLLSSPRSDSRDVVEEDGGEKTTGLSAGRGLGRDSTPVEVGGASPATPDPDGALSSPSGEVHTSPPCDSEGGSAPAPGRPLALFADMGPGHDREVA